MITLCAVGAKPAAMTILAWLIFIVIAARMAHRGRPR